MSEVFARPYCPLCLRASGCDCDIGLIDLDGELIVEWRDRYDSLFRYYAHKYGLNWRRIKAQTIAESSLNPRAVSPVGAIGLMQFMPATWAEWGKGDPTDPEASIDAGCRYMAHLYGCYGEIPDPDERYRFALSAYNWGRGNVNKALSLARQEHGHPASFAEWEALGRPPGPWQIWGNVAKYMPRETQNYVRRMLARLRDDEGGDHREVSG